MTPIEALFAATQGGAWSLQREDVGHLRPGAKADLLILDAPSHVHPPTRPGVPLVRRVIDHPLLVLRKCLNSEHFRRSESKLTRSLGSRVRSGRFCRSLRFGRSSNCEGSTLRNLLRGAQETAPGSLGEHPAHADPSDAESSGFGDSGERRVDQKVDRLGATAATIADTWSIDVIQGA